MAESRDPDPATVEQAEQAIVRFRRPVHRWCRSLPTQEDVSWKRRCSRENYSEKIFEAFITFSKKAQLHSCKRQYNKFNITLTKEYSEVLVDLTFSF